MTSAPLSHEYAGEGEEDLHGRLALVVLVLNQAKIWSAALFRRFFRPNRRALWWLFVTAGPHKY